MARMESCEKCNRTGKIKSLGRTALFKRNQKECEPIEKDCPDCNGEGYNYYEDDEFKEMFGEPVKEIDLTQAVIDLTEAVKEFSEMYKSVHTVPKSAGNNCQRCLDSGMVMCEMNGIEYMKKCPDCNS